MGDESGQQVLDQVLEQMWRISPKHSSAVEQNIFNFVKLISFSSLIFFYPIIKTESKEKCYCEIDINSDGQFVIFGC